ncbi:MAG: hypothetical protein P4M01_00555 [Acidobacteriota bacterium]|nr:hypothetical protein [Acidobacteriota bacterium]
MSNTQMEMGWGGKLGRGAGKLFRFAKGKPGRNSRYFHGVVSGAGAFFSALSTALRVLFLELSGLLFLLFSISIVVAFFREYHQYEQHHGSLERVVLAGAVGAMFLYFGVSSFWRARRRRSRTS